MKMITLPPYTEKLDPERQEVFKKLKKFSSDFTLAGGTALMLQIGHRLSYDFDCFSMNLLPDSLLRIAKNIFGKTILPELDTREQLTFKTPQRVSITFVYHPYKTLKALIKTSFIPLFDLDDLAANKAYTIGRRPAWRDYIDLFFFLKWNLYDIDTIIKFAEKKFRGEFNPKLFLEQLVYFDDLNISPTKFLKESYTDTFVKSFLEKKVADYLKKVL